MNILALDTSTEACSAALLRADGRVFAEFEIAPRQHMRLLPEMLDQVMAAAGVGKEEITHCAFTNGPGAFTGIRIAAAQAQGIGLALDIPLLPVSTLATLAQTSLDRYDYDKILVALDARMNEIYWATYVRDAKGCAALEGKEQLSAATAVHIDDSVDLGSGHGWTQDLRERAACALVPELLPDARSLLRLAQPLAQAQQGIDARHIEINYLRNQVAEKAD